MDKDDKTVIYYTGHREEPEFEERIKQTLLETIGDLPLISVSQKPIQFGKNICVGEVGTSVHNAWRQLQIGTQVANTKLICVAESDYLYPKEYFSFQPDREDKFYSPVPMYVLFAQNGKSGFFCLKPKGQEGATVVGRNFLLSRLETMFMGLPLWSGRTPEQHKSRRETNALHLFGTHAIKRFATSIPVINFKTDNNLHQRTQYRPSTNCIELPYWGNALDLINRYIWGVQ